MTIKLSRPFASNSAVEDFDLRQMKKTLNRLGYYTPFEKTGITGISDAEVFQALKEFQKDQNLPATGTAKPDDETIDALNREADKTPDGYYIWRTVEDGHVRAAHAKLNRTVRKWSDSPDPGDDFNCRCWAEPITNENIADQFNFFKFLPLFGTEEFEIATHNLEKTTKNTEEEHEPKNTAGLIAKAFNIFRLKSSQKFLENYLDNKGLSFKLSPQDILKSSAYKNAIQTNQKRFEQSLTNGPFSKIIENMTEGQTIFLKEPSAKNADNRWDYAIHRMGSDAINDLDQFASTGSIQISSLATMQATRHANNIEISGEVYHTLIDTYDFNEDTTFDKILFSYFRSLAKEHKAKAFKVYGSTSQQLDGLITIQNGKIGNIKFTWKDAN